MVSSNAKEVFIQGITRSGKTFRPSDWAERLAGVMAQFHPAGKSPGAHLSYSPWCIPQVINGVKCVVVNRALRDYEVMAWDFVMNFARDNDLQVVEACLLPDPPRAGTDPTKTHRDRWVFCGGEPFCWQRTRNKRRAWDLPGPGLEKLQLRLQRPGP